jgi:hypothetical protein
MNTEAMSPKQAAFREEYKRNIAPWYNGWGHLLSIFVPGIAVVWYCIASIQNPTLWELLLAAPVLLFYNWNEWWLHKNAMHRPRRNPDAGLPSPHPPAPSVLHRPAHDLRQQP